MFPKIQALKTWLDKCLKSPVSEGHSTSNILTCPGTVETSITAPLSYSLVTGNEFMFEKVSLIDMTNLGTSC